MLYQIILKLVMNYFVTDIPGHIEKISKLCRNLIINNDSMTLQIDHHLLQDHRAHSQ
jgi:hypothetical protein